MPGDRPFIDTNIFLYLLSEDSEKADRAEQIVRAGGRISVQVLNEFANTARRKLVMSWGEINEALDLIRSLCPVDSLTVETHEQGLMVAAQYKSSIYDSMIIAAALLGECDVLYSEDMQDGLLIDRQLRVHNPFSNQAAH